MEEFLLLVLCLAALFLVIYLDYRIAKVFERAANMKGHNGKPFFWWCFFLGLIGFLMVIALPDRAGGGQGPVSGSDLPPL